jgi:NADPH-dependent glutamate synthase beta subunit-like oxidoreductase
VTSASTSSANQWGFSAVVLAHGAWRDRPLPVEGADDYLGKGLVYQNSFIYWFNHFTELGYQGPQYEVVDGAIVVGGGLASIDVMKVLQLEGVRNALAEQGIDEDMEKLETDGIPAVLAEHGLSWERLNLHGATLYYRRRLEDMPLADADTNDPAKRAKLEMTRRKILEKAMQKYCFAVEPLRAPVGLLVEGDRLAGLRFQRTRVENGKAVPVDGAFEDVHAPLVGELDRQHPRADAGDRNVRSALPVGGQPARPPHGLRHRLQRRQRGDGEGQHPRVAEAQRDRQHARDRAVLGLGNGKHDGEEALAPSTAGVDAAAQKIAEVVKNGKPLAPPSPMR